MRASKTPRKLDPLLFEGERHRQLGELLGRLRSGLHSGEMAEVLTEMRDIVDRSPDGLHYGWLVRLKREAEGVEAKASGPGRGRAVAAAKLLIGACTNALRTVEPHGQVMGLLFRESDSSGFCQRIAVGTHRTSLDVDKRVRDSFEDARRAVAAVLTLESGTKVSASCPSLEALTPTLPGKELLVGGYSAGLAYGLAVLSYLFHALLGSDPRWAKLSRQGAFRVASHLSVTGVIGPNGSVLPLQSPDATPKKLDAALADSPEPEKAAVIVYPTDAPERRGRNRLRILAVKSLREAAVHAFPMLGNELPAALQRVAEKLENESAAGERSPASNGVREFLKEQLIFDAGIAVCGNEPWTFLALSTYFAFLAESERSSPRAPEEWASALDESVAMRLDSTSPATRVNVLGFARFSFDQAVTEGVVPFESDKHAAAAYRRIDERIHGRIARGTVAGIDEEEFFSIIRMPAGERSREQRSRLSQVRQRIIADPAVTGSFAAMIELISSGLGPSFRELFHRRRLIDIGTVAPGQVGSEDAIKNGKGLANSTLGFAWGLKYFIPHLKENGLRDSKQCSRLDTAFNLPPLPQSDHDRFWDGIKATVRNQGTFVVFVERPFHPRVLWEVLSETNRRYPAEKLLATDSLRQFQQECPGLVVLWNHDLLPLVADLRSDDRNPDLRKVRRLGQVYVQDYPAHGRTNHANVFFGVPSLADLQMREFNESQWPNPWQSGDELEKEIFWSRGRGTGDSWSVDVINARSSAVYAAEALRKQVIINSLLDHRQAIDGITLNELMSVPWFSTPFPNSFAGRDAGIGAFMEYLIGRGKLLVDIPRGLRRFGSTTFLPLFWDPFTWRGVGLASAWAFEGTIAVIMLRALRSLRRATQSKRSAAAKAQAELEMSLDELTLYIQTEYLDDLVRMHSLISRVIDTIGHGPGSHQKCEDCAELRQAKERLVMIQDMLESEVRA